MWVRVFGTRNNNIFVVIAIMFGVGPISRNPRRAYSDNATVRVPYFLTAMTNNRTRSEGIFS